MLETPAGIFSAREIATASERLAVLVMGTNDIAKELHAEQVPGRQPLQHALSTCLLAARLAGKVILDGVYNDIKDPDGFEAECLQGRAMGFDGKTLIHPSQVDPCNRSSPPTRRRWPRPGRSSPPSRPPRPRARASSPVNGRMIENLHVDNARRALALDEAITALQQPS
jgi:citrate lyase subunit beta/citryl-CoA lyase